MLSRRICGFGPFDSLRRELKCPRNDHSDRKTERCEKNNKSNRPGRNFHERKNLCCDLNQKPANDGIRGSYLVNIPPLQLAEEFLRIHRTSLLALIFRCERVDDLLEARIAPKGSPKRMQFQTAVICITGHVQ